MNGTDLPFKRPYIFFIPKEHHWVLRIFEMTIIMNETNEGYRVEYHCTTYKIWSPKLCFGANWLPPNKDVPCVANLEPGDSSSLLALARPFGTLRSKNDAMKHLLTRSKDLVPTSTLCQACSFGKLDFYIIPRKDCIWTLFSQWIQRNICGLT